MNEFLENRNEIPKIQEFSQPSEYQSFNFDDLIKEANTFIAETNDFIKGLTADTKDAINVREYGLRECTDAAKNIFTPETLREWGNKSYEQRNQIVQEYAKAIGNGLNIDFKGVIFESLLEQPKPSWGYNSGDGYIHLDHSFIKDPSQVIKMIDTVAHELRHQYHFEAVKNPEKFDIDQATVNEWKAGLENYSTQYATAYDPWGYFYNPVEIDARYFGESIVRELRKGLINQNIASIDNEKRSIKDTTTFSSAEYHESWAKSKAKDATRHSEQIAKEKSKNWQDYERQKAKDYAKAAAAEQKKADEIRKKQNKK